MKIITGITEQPRQTMALFLADGSKVTLSLRWVSNQLGWFFDVSRGDFAADGLRVVASPNLLRQFREIAPFGLAVLTAGGAEPLTLGSLSAASTQLVLLEAEDVAAVEAAVYVGG